MARQTLFFPFRAHHLNIVPGNRRPGNPMTTTATRAYDNKRKNTCSRTSKSLVIHPQVPVSSAGRQYRPLSTVETPFGIFERSAAKLLNRSRVECFSLDNRRSLSARRNVPADPDGSSGWGLPAVGRQPAGSRGKALNQQGFARSPCVDHVPSGFTLCILPNDGNHIIGGKTLVAQQVPSLR